MLHLRPLHEQVGTTGPLEAPWQPPDVALTRFLRRESKCFAVWGQSLNVLLLVGIMASLIGATLAFVAVDLNDARFDPNAEENKGGVDCKLFAAAVPS